MTTTPTAKEMRETRTKTLDTLALVFLLFGVAIALLHFGWRDVEEHYGQQCFGKMLVGWGNMLYGVAGFILAKCLNPWKGR